MACGLAGGSCCGVALRERIFLIYDFLITNVIKKFKRSIIAGRVVAIRWDNCTHAEMAYSF